MQAFQNNVAWRAIPVAWFVAGTVFLLVNMTLSALAYGIEPLLMLLYSASIVQGTEVLVNATTMTYVIGIAVHYFLSLIFVFIITIAIHRWGLWVGILGGAVLGLAIYGINFYTMTLFFDWMYAINSPVLAISHVTFGAVAGGCYELLDTYDEPLQPEGQS